VRPLLIGQILASFSEAPAFVFRRLSTLFGQVSETMGNCLKSPTSDDVSLLREGGHNSNSVEQLEHQSYPQVANFANFLCVFFVLKFEVFFARLLSFFFMTRKKSA